MRLIAILLILLSTSTFAQRIDGEVLTSKPIYEYDNSDNFYVSAGLAVLGGVILAKGGNPTVGGLFVATSATISIDAIVSKKRRKGKRWASKTRFE